MKIRYPLGKTLAVSCVLIACSTAALSQQPQRTAGQWLGHFSEHWQEDHWRTPSRAYPGGYLRRPDDAGWQARMRALQGLVAGGEEALPLLLETLRQGNAPQRILAAQALTYLAPQAPRGALLQAARNDPDPAVRLYAVDVLGMQGQAQDPVDWQALLEAESNRDVRRHIGYAIERGQQGISAEVLQRLQQWEPTQIDLARLGQPAPDFQLRSATGEQVRLSQFRGKQAVVRCESIPNGATARRLL